MATTSNDVSATAPATPEPASLASALPWFEDLLAWIMSLHLQVVDATGPRTAKPDPIEIMIAPELGAIYLLVRRSTRHLGDRSCGVLNAELWKHHRIEYNQRKCYVGYKPTHDGDVAAIMYNEGPRHTRAIFHAFWEMGAALEELLYTAIRRQQLSRRWIQRASILRYVLPETDGDNPRVVPVADADIPGVFPMIPFNLPIDPLTRRHLPTGWCPPADATLTLREYAFTTIGHHALQRLVNPVPDVPTPAPPADPIVTQWSVFGSPPTGKWRWAAFTCTPPVARSKIFIFHNGVPVERAVIEALELPEVLFELGLLVFVSLRSQDDIFRPLPPLYPQPSPSPSPSPTSESSSSSSSSRPRAARTTSPPPPPYPSGPFTLSPSLTLLKRPLYDLLTYFSTTHPIVGLWTITARSTQYSQVLLTTLTASKLHVFAARAYGRPLPKSPSPTLRLSLIVHGCTRVDHEELVMIPELLPKWHKGTRFRLVLRVRVDLKDGGEREKVAEWMVPGERAL